VARDLAVVAREEGTDASLFEATRRKAVELNMKEIEYHRLDRTREENEKLYAMLLEKVKEADLARMMRVNNIRVVDVATEPGGSIRPRVSANVGIGVALGLLLGLAFAWVRQQLDSSVKSPDDLEQKLGLSFLGLLRVSPTAPPAIRSSSWCTTARSAASPKRREASVRT
jgi:uncharacterized protein involved in exopolysaccharide biosynthesis